MSAGLSDLDHAFMAASTTFRAAVDAAYGEPLDELRASLAAPSRPATPTFLEDAAALTDMARAAIVDDFYGPSGVAEFVASQASGRPHPLLALAAQLAGELPTAHPVDHPMEAHHEARARFGDPDGTLKIYDLPVDPSSSRYREQAETNEAFDAHNDGLGYAGVIAASALWTDSPPLWGGYTHFANVVRASALLAEDDPEAFRSLFLPDAITCLRPRGKGAIRVTSPVLFLGATGQPQVFLRIASGEYQVSWRRGVPALDRARAFCERLVGPFAPGSIFVHFMAPGEGVLIRNQHVVHGRTPFVDGPGRQRVLARKWYVENPLDAEYRHVPGMALQAEWANLLPERFGPGATSGEWNYVPDLDDNVRID